MRHRTLLIAVVLVGLGMTASADATPYVGQSREASAQVRLLGTDGSRYQINVSVIVTGQVTSADIHQVKVSIAQCRESGCGSALVYSRIASSSELSVSSDNAIITLRSSFGGYPLRAIWNFGGLDAANSNTGVTNSGATVGSEATGPVTVTVLSASCPDPQATSSNVITASVLGRAAASGAWLSKAPAGFAPKRGRRVTCTPAARA